MSSSLLMFLMSAMMTFASPQVRRPETVPPHSATIEGQVRTSGDTPLSNFSVVAIDQKSRQQYGAITNESGTFRIEGLPAGTYDLFITREGFSEVQRAGIAVQPDARISIVVEVPLNDSTPGRPRSTFPGGGAPVESNNPDSIRRPEPLPETNPILVRKALEEDFIPMRNRWDIELPPWNRFPSGHTLGPYNQSRLKGDYPIFGDRWFLSLSATSNTLVEGRRLPVGGPASSERANEPDFFSRGTQLQGSENLILTADLFHGLTTFKPVDLRFRFSPVLNASYLAVRETGLVNINVQKHDTRFDHQVPGLQEAFVEVRLPESSPRFDFISTRVGTQQFNSDFRGFIFFDNEPGIRVFGNLKSNKYQYNAAYFYMLEKDTNSLLNTTRRRDQEVLIGNFYVQDFITSGYTTQISVHYNRDKPSFHIDKNGFFVRPAPVGFVIPKSINAIYAGWTGDGHIGRWNVDHALYQVLGRERPNPISGDIFGPLTGRINAQMAAFEISFDQDWKRYRASAFYASGDSNPADNQSRGFDSIFDNVQFAGGDISFWNRQGIRLTGTGLGLNQRFSLNPALRTSKEEGQANFVNPGLFLLNAGFDAELTPKIRASINVNALSFAHTQVLETLLFQSHIRHSIGIDTGIGVRWRPLLSNNIIFKFGAAALIPAAGFKQIYSSQTLFSTFTELKLTY